MVMTMSTTIYVGLVVSEVDMYVGMEIIDILEF